MKEFQKLNQKQISLYYLQIPIKHLIKVKILKCFEDDDQTMKIGTISHPIGLDFSYYTGLLP